MLTITGHGVLFVDARNRYRIYERLQRDRAGYPYEIKFGRVSRDNRKAQLFRVAQAWISTVFDELGDGLAFKAAFTDHASPYFEAPYRDDPRWPKHVKHSTSLPVLGLARFRYAGFDHVTVQPVFDDTGSQEDKAAFAAGLQLAERRARDRRDAGRVKYPRIIAGRIHYVSSNPQEIAQDDIEAQIDSEFVQLVDLLLGSCREAFAPRSRAKPGRLVLARDIATTLKELWDGRWWRYAERARSFTVTVWPNEFGLPYNPRLRSLERTDNQLQFEA